MLSKGEIMNKKILVVDDDRMICNVITEYGTRLGYNVTSITDSLNCLQLLREENFDLIILDVAMPNLNGFELYSKIKGQHSTPVLFLSAKAHPSDRITGLKLGAEDYVVKPFSLEELYIKINKIITRSTNFELVIDDFEFNLLEMVVKYKQQQLKLTKKEYKLLMYLVKNKGKIVSRDEIMREVWNLDYFLDTSIVNSHIKTLRKQFDQNIIKTVRGQGYMYEID